MATSYPRRTTTGGVWKVTDVAQNLLEHGTWPGSPTPGGRGMFGGGYAPSHNATIQYITISTTGNATDFGDLTSARGTVAGNSSFTRFVVGGGTPGASTVIEYVTMASTGNAADFGDLTDGRNGMAAMGNSTRGLFSGGLIPSASNIIDYITIATVGNAIDFGNLTVARQELGGVNSPTRGISAGSMAPSNVIDFIEFSTLGDAVDFGDLTSARYPASASSSTRGTFAGGNPAAPYIDIIDYVTIAAKGDATDFGDLTTPRAGLSTNVASSTRGIFAGGREPTVVDSIDYITFASTGDAADFGDLTDNFYQQGGGSDSHGGLEAYDPRPRPAGIGRGFFGGGYTAGTEHDTIEEILIPTTGNTTDFGNLTFGRSATWGCASSLTRAVLMGGHVANPYLTATIDAFEMTSKGNACDFGDLTAASRGAAMVSSATRGVVGGGADS